MSGNVAVANRADARVEDLLGLKVINSSLKKLGIRYVKSEACYAYNNDDEGRISISVGEFMFTGHNRQLSSFTGILVIADEDEVLRIDDLEIWNRVAGDELLFMELNRLVEDCASSDEIIAFFGRIDTEVVFDLD